MGYTSKAPRWAIAYKWAARQATTLVREIGFNVGRTGTLTPVAFFEPVPIGGVTVSRSTLHNMDEIERLNIHEGDTVLVERAGDVIPHVLKVVKHGKQEKPVRVPEKCPVCGTRIHRVEGEVAYRCVNAACPAKRKESLLHFAGRHAMNIDGLGEKIVDQLIEKGIVKDFASLYELKLDEVAALERMAEKSAQNLLDEIAASKKNSAFAASLRARHRLCRRTHRAIARRTFWLARENRQCDARRADGSPRNRPEGRRQHRRFLLRETESQID